MSESDKISIFISHRHIDRELADVFRETMGQWSDGSVGVYQSSHAGNASRISADLDSSIAEAIADSNLVLLIYTQAPGDMDWCMFECGLAQDPRRRETRVAVFHTTQSPPDPLEGLICMQLAEDSVYKFTHGFHRDPNFLPGMKEAIHPDISDEELLDRSRELYSQLKKGAPERARESTVYDRLTVGLSYHKIEKIRSLAKTEKLEDVYAAANDMLPDSLIVRSASGSPEEHFNYSNLDQNVTFADLVSRWRSDSSFSKGNEWPEGVCEAITRTILERPEREIAYCFDSLESDGARWLMPVLSRYRTVPFDRIVEFDLLFCRINKETALKMIN